MVSKAKKSTESKKKTKASPKKKTAKINFNDVIKMCEVQCTEEEIAAYIGVHQETLRLAIKEKFNCDFRVFFAQHRLKGHQSLRRKQYDVAMNGNKGEGDAGMLKFLGKNWLGQMEKPERQIELEGNINVKTVNVDPKLLSDSAIEEFLAASDCRENDLVDDDISKD